MSMCDYCIQKEDCVQPEWHTRAVKNGHMYCFSFKSFIKRSISMAYVTPAFVTGNKTVTRRDWALRTVGMFEYGTKVLVWNKQARFGGEPIGVLELTENPFKQKTSKMPVSDYVAEGFAYIDEMLWEMGDESKPLENLFFYWQRSDQYLSVIKFKTLEVFPMMEDKYTTDEEIVRCVKALRKAFA